MTSEFLPSARVDPLRLAAAAYLARYKGQSRVHSESDLRAYLRWCVERGVDPLKAARPHGKLYVRWLQEHRRYAASTVSRRIAVVAGFYRTCVIDGVLEHSPAEYVRRPTVSTQSPTLGLSHLQFEALLAAARDSANPNDFALVCLLGLLGLRIFEATNLNISDIGEQHGHRVVRVVGKGNKIALVPLPPAVARAVDRAVGDRAAGPLLRNRLEARMDRHAATHRPHQLRKRPGVRIARMHPRMLRHTFVTTMLDAGVDCVTPESPPGTSTRAPPCVTTARAPTSTGTPTTSSLPTCPPAPNRRPGSRPDLPTNARSHRSTQSTSLPSAPVT